MEIKGISRVDKRDLHSLTAFADEYSPKKTILVCNERRKRIHKGIEIAPWQEFLKNLWNGNIL